MAKFKVGDRVRAKTNTGDPNVDIVAGMVGTVSQPSFSPLGFSVTFDDVIPTRASRNDCHLEYWREWYLNPKDVEFEVNSQLPSTLLPSDSAERKKIPLGTGVLDYFTSALIEVARVSHQGNEQHNPGQPLHWARGKSRDHVDTMLRHFVERGTLDVDGTRHSAKMVWRALAVLQLELEAEGAPMARGAKNDTE